MKKRFVALWITIHCVAVAECKAPNILMVLIDDMGWADFSCFGNADAETPNIDRMAREGLSFSQFYVNSPICSPSRVAFSTGQYPQRWQITSYLASREQNTRRGMAQWLDPKAPMLARSLQEAGYLTGHFGKWHMGGQRDVSDAPAISAYGFDRSLTNFEGMGAKLLPLITRADGSEEKIWEDAENLGEPVTWMPRARITSGFIDATIPFMEEAHKAGKPFYANLWLDDVHSPFWPSVEELRAHQGNTRKLYLSVLEEMDRQLAKLFDHLRDHDSLRNNTIVLICSDNGPEKGAGSAGHLRGYKTQLYEGGIRSSLIVWAPALMNPMMIGQRNSGSVFSAIDLAPSLLSLAGVKNDRNIPYDGENLADTILGKSQDSRKAPLHFSRPPDRKNYYGDKQLPDLAIRDGDWKLLCDYDGSRASLYDLASDPHERQNLVAREREISLRMISEIQKWHLSFKNANRNR
jgi:uncharacterized sulfatase